MKVIVTADIHYGVGNNQEIIKNFARKICATGADVLILAGDTFAIEQNLLAGCLRLFDRFKGLKLYISGNHDLWLLRGNSYYLYQKVLPALVRKCEFHDLDQSPVIYKGVGFVGNIGWYDYSFRDFSVPIPQKYYTEKQWPNVVIWNDRLYVKLGMSDQEFVNLLDKKLKKHLKKVSSSKTSSIICITHCLPFKELLPDPSTSLDKYLAAFSGNTKAGETILQFPKVKYVFCGHTHQRKTAMIKGINCINIGSDYLRKRYETIEI